MIFGLYKLPMVKTDNERVLLRDGQVLDIEGIQVECFLVPGHTWGHMVYLIDGAYLFTGDTLWFDPDAPYDAYNESDDTEEKARGGWLKKQNRS